MPLRHLLSWKSLFYGAALPALRRLGPSRADAVLGGLGRLSGAVLPGRRRTLKQAADRAAREIGPSVGDRRTFRIALASSVARHLARDYPLEGATDAELAARFDVSGFDHIKATLAGGRGVVLLGSHLGGHLAALHWMIRHGLPMRWLVQRPRHVSPTMIRWLDTDAPLHPQSTFFLRRSLPPAEAAARVLRARDALRSGLAVYLNGDIPWDAANARPGRLLGDDRSFLSVWSDLAVLAGAPVVPVFCTHQPGGRFALTFEPPFRVISGGQDGAVAAYLARLDAEIAAHPNDAVPHLTWPAYQAPSDSKFRPERRPTRLAASRPRCPRAPRWS